MSASLVGSEMCIRDRTPPGELGWPSPQRSHSHKGFAPVAVVHVGLAWPCLLYTSDAADDM
eukprot:12656483-Alexandrium_andersonii.AAC.1